MTRTVTDNCSGMCCALVYVLTCLVLGASKVFGGGYNEEHFFPSRSAAGWARLLSQRDDSTRTAGPARYAAAGHGQGVSKF